VACRPLLGNDRDINNYTTAVTTQKPVNSNKRNVFSVQAVPRCRKQDELASFILGVKRKDNPS
jgi:hypothetical protein